jgi:GTP-binding protein
MPGIIAIVGRPNVGKSALFNRIAGRRIAIVHDQPGVTRDRVMAECEWRGCAFTLVDTGGLGLLRGEKVDDPVVQATIKQVEIAIESAHVILMVVNVQEGLVPLDQEVAGRLRPSGKPVLLVVNKVDTAAFSAGAADFASLGFGQAFEVSAVHGRGVDGLMRAVLGRLPRVAPSEPGPADQASSEASPASQPLKLAIVGRPNVGKSSLINALTRSERVIVSPIPGTTRDSVDVPFTVETDGRQERYTLIDTAGIRKGRSIHNDVEFYSVRRAEDSIARCDLVVLVLDAEAGILEQDKKIADRILEEHKACVLVVNKWDLYVEQVRQLRQKVKTQKPAVLAREGAPRLRSTIAEFSQWVQQTLFFLDYAPVIFTSAHSGHNLDRLLEAVRYVASQLQQKIPTAILNRALHQAVENRQPVSDAGHRLKFFYATQTEQVPPTFRLFVNRADLFSDAYARYLADELRKAFGYEGCPIVLAPKSRSRTIEPKRKIRSEAERTRMKPRYHRIR